MLSRNWEDWTFGLTVAAALALALAMSEAGAPSFLRDAIAGEYAGPEYSITVTAKRLPAECKGAATYAAASNCAALFDNTRVTIRANR